MSNNINVQQLLAQMRVMEAQAKAQITEPGAINQANNVNGPDFSELLANQINQVNDTMQASGKMAAAFEKGEADISMAQLMVQMEKSSVSFQAMTQIRNRLLSAYQEIMNMPV